MQMTLFQEKHRESNGQKQYNVSQWGTFKDSLKAPVHSWFTYPAGFSFKAVQHVVETHALDENHYIYDPFMGSGTTNLTAKSLAVNSIGVEAHPFVYKIARAKLSWEINEKEVNLLLDEIRQQVIQHKVAQVDLKEHLEDVFPELVLKCYDLQPLYELLLIRRAIERLCTEEIYDFFFVALTGLLRQVSSAATGWPYIAPNRIKTTSATKAPLATFEKHITKMLVDIKQIQHEAKAGYLETVHKITNGDSRDTKGFIPDETVDLIFTSPPYLNNFDYADRTRLELYFFGEAKNWSDITQNYRAKLMTSATTQIIRTDKRYELSTDLRDADSKVYSFIYSAVQELSILRNKKGGKKSYDLMVAGYFNDMFLNLKDAYRVLKKGQCGYYVLGDSAPYGVHIPTDEIIGKIGEAIGFSGYSIEVLRTRGEKWKENPQRHNVRLRESIVKLVK